MNFRELSNSALRMLYDPIREALKHDDALPAGQPKEYGIREHPDFRVWTSALEAEMDCRGMRYESISW